MRRLTIATLALMLFAGCPSTPPTPVTPVEETASAYIEHWSAAFPTAALLAGRSEEAARAEHLAADDIEEWMHINLRFRDQLRHAPEQLSLDDRIDRALLGRKIEHELYRWGEARALETDPLTYSSHINHLLTPILVRRSFSAEERKLGVLSRLRAIDDICGNARRQLSRARPTALGSAVTDLRATAAFYRDGLATALGVSPDETADADARDLIAAAARELEALAQWLETAPLEQIDDAYGEVRFTRELALAYGSALTPKRLEELAFEEIEAVRSLMAALARDILGERGGSSMPGEFDALVRPLLREMEETNAGGQAAFLDEFLDLIERSRRFLEHHDLAEVPLPETLFTALSPPHFAGASVGGVYPAGPFDPEAETLFYLPSVPDSAPDELRDGFYRSFNTFFNSTIITHEIYPGHYLQLKAAARHPRPIRPLFAGDAFTEGWASFCEQMTLDAGWDRERPLTRMAHLRKRLENAVRAWVSVQVHCRGWSREQLHAFAVERGLLPPQFAENLWQRTMLSPIQLPSYFVGFRAFDALFRMQREQLGESFRLRDFNSAVLGSGGIPMELLDEYLRAELDEADDTVD
jgi:uncharacterized protein (DUF885 family)